MDKEKSLYFIRIITLCDGKESLFSAPVRVSWTEDGFLASYKTYGGPCELALCGRRLSMKRQGSAAFSCDFEQGHAGEMILSLEGSIATVPMHTQRLNIIPSDDKFEADLEYDLLFDETISHFCLHLHIFSGGPMKIVYYGHSCFSLQSGAGISVLTDPYGDVGFLLPHITSDAVTVSHGHYDHCNISAVEYSALFDHAGKYEFGGMEISAQRRWHDEVHGAKRGENLIFSYLIDGIRIVHLGDCGMRAEELPEDLSPDVLLIPVGGNYTIDAEEALRYIMRLSPKIVVPMHYRVEGLTVDIEGVERFIRLAAKKFPIEHAGSVLELSGSDLPKTTKIIVMERKI